MHYEVFGKDIKKLGFGFMRLPENPNGRHEVDLDETIKMVDLFMGSGFTYFDTAYVYGGGKSEEALRESLVKRYPRDSFKIADKLPLWAAEGNKDKLRELTETSLKRLGVSYFDYYLIHSLHDDTEVNKLDAWSYMKGLKEEGIAKHIGFSFHGTPEILDEMLTAHPEAEFVQLQINYIDWDNADVQSGKCYEAAKKHGKPVIVMEPVKGGSLATISPYCSEPYNKLAGGTPASYAIRFAASLEGVHVVLSGMSNLAQVTDNAAYMRDFTPLDNSEREAVSEVTRRLNEIELIPCTKCKYCIDGCPMKIDIPGIFEAANDYKKFNSLKDAKRHYGHITRESGKASECISCRACEGICPQHIIISERLAEISTLLD